MRLEGLKFVLYNDKKIEFTISLCIKNTVIVSWVRHGKFESRNYSMPTVLSRFKDGSWIRTDREIHVLNWFKERLRKEVNRYELGKDVPVGTVTVTPENIKNLLHSQFPHLSTYGEVYAYDDYLEGQTDKDNLFKIVTVEDGNGDPYKWMDVTAIAEYLWNEDLPIELYQVYDDGSEGLVGSIEDIKDRNSYWFIGIEVGL